MKVGRYVQNMCMPNTLLLLALTGYCGTLARAVQTGRGFFFLFFFFWRQKEACERVLCLSFFSTFSYFVDQQINWVGKRLQFHYDYVF